MNKYDIPMKNIALDTIAAKKVAQEKGIKSYPKATPMKDNTSEIVINDLNSKMKHENVHKAIKKPTLTNR